MTVPPRLLEAGERLTRVRVGAVLTALLGAGAVLNPARPLPIDLCLLKAWTGLSCPTCGLTRAVCHVLQGDWAASLEFHPAGILVVVSVVGWVTWMSLEAWRGQLLWERRRKVLAQLGGGGIVLISLATWVARL
jgi:Protein of unknown function (DUF2752)